MSRPITIEEMVRLFKERHPYSHLLKIDNFSLLEKYEIEECKSSVFDIGGFKWKLILYPNGNKDDNGKGHVSLYLERKDSKPLPSNWDDTVEVKLFVVNQYRAHREHGPVVCNASRTKWGSGRLISLVDFKDSTKGHFYGDCAMFGVKLFGLQAANNVTTAECFTLIEKPPNHRVTWKIAQFSSFLPDTDHDSNEFVIGGRKWIIKLYPRGCNEAEGNSVSVFLKALGHTDYALKTKTYTKFKLKILDQINRKHYERKISWWFPAEPSSRGYRKFMSLGDFHDTSNGYLVNDMLYVGVEMDVVSMTKSC